MSLSIALSSALSGINLTARATQLVSDNIANAQTEGYGVRTLSQTAQVTGHHGSGVLSIGIHRDSDPALLAELRHAKAQNTREEVASGFWTRLEAAFGMPDEPGGLTYLIDALEASLQNAASQPESSARLRHVSQATSDIARSFGSLHKTILAQRDTADAAISKDIASLNQALVGIAELNKKIQRQILQGLSPASLEDARQQLVTDVSHIISVQEIARDDGRILLMGRDGSILVDRTAAQFGFTRTQVTEASDRVETGALSRITLNDRDLAQDTSLFVTGRLGAFVQIRDIDAPRLQEKLDNLAYDLVIRFSQPDLDPSLPPAGFGLFAIDGKANLPTDKIGISGLLSLNPLADPDAGGALWRLRSGMGLSTAPVGETADNALLTRKLRVLGASRALPGGSVPKSAAAHAADTLSSIASERLVLDQRRAATTARVSALDEAFTARGVDTNAELSKLLVLEHAYAANARVIATIDSMWRSMLEIV